MSKNHYRAIHASLLRHCSEMAELLRPFDIQATAFNLDGFTDESAWPSTDFVGLAEFRLTMDGFYEGTAIITLSLVEDTNLLRSAELVEAILDRMLPNESIPVYNAQTGLEIGLLYVKSGVEVGTPLVAKTRPIIPILFGFTSNLTTG